MRCIAQVHVRQQRCANSPLVTCNCAVSVRENNDIIGLFACNASAVTPIRYLEDANSPPGTARMVVDLAANDYTVGAAANFIQL